MPHIFKPGDMALITVCASDPRAVGMVCIVETHPYEQMMRRPDKTTYSIVCVDITIGHPTLKAANIDCLQYIPPEEWPKSEYKQRKLVRVEGAPNESDTKRREPATTE